MDLRPGHNLRDQYEDRGVPFCPAAVTRRGTTTLQYRASRRPLLSGAMLS